MRAARAARATLTGLKGAAGDAALAARGGAAPRKQHGAGDSRQQRPLCRPRRRSSSRRQGPAGARRRRAAKKHGRKLAAVHRAAEAGIPHRGACAQLDKARAAARCGVSSTDRAFGRSRPVEALRTLPSVSSASCSHCLSTNLAQIAGALRGSAVTARAQQRVRRRGDGGTAADPTRSTRVPCRALAFYEPDATRRRVSRRSGARPPRETPRGASRPYATRATRSDDAKRARAAGQGRRCDRVGRGASPLKKRAGTSIRLRTYARGAPPPTHLVPYRLNCRRASAPLAPARALPVPDSLPHALLARRYLAATGARRRAGFRRLLFRRAALRLASLLSSLQLRVARTGGAGDNCAVLRRTASACTALAWVRLAAVCRWPLPPAGES